MPLPKNYAAGGEGAIASYNATDIAAGTGVIDFYAGKTSGACILSNIKYYSDAILTQVTPLQTTWTKSLDLDFDAPINRPLTIKGKSVVNVPFNLSIASTSGVSGQCIVRVRKWNGTTETEIASGTSRYIEWDGTGTAAYEMFAIDVDIPLTHFKKGETLRLTIEGWGSQEAAVAATLKIGHDPMNRYKSFGHTNITWDATNTPPVPSILSFQVPVRIEL